MDLSFFKPGTDGMLYPQPPAGSGWGNDHMRGMAISGAMARAVEHEVSDLARDDLQPARWTIDLFRVARMRPTTVTARIVRAGRRLCLVDAEFVQDGRPVARASALFLATSEAQTAVVWSPELPFTPPALDFPRTPDVERLYRAGDGGWVVPADMPHDDTRKQVWQYPIAIVDGEEPSGFAMAASVADVASAAANSGSEGLQFVNADVTLTLARVPDGLELGMTTLTRVEQDGIAVGSTQVFDRRGQVGTAVVCALANTAHTVDLRRHGHGGNPA